MNKHAPISLGIELELRNILLALKKVTDPYQLGTQLGIATHYLQEFEYDYPKDIERQKIEVINFWLDNNEDCSWEVLADAVKGMGGYGKIVDSLRELHRRARATNIIHDEH